MPGIESVAVALPSNYIDRSHITEIANEWISDNPDLANKYQRIALNSGVESRRLILPYKDILKIGGLKERALIFEELGEQLLMKAFDDLFKKSSHKADQVSHLIFTSCSVPLIPSVDAKLILNSSLKNTIRRVPIFQHGCVGGVVGLSLAHEFVKSGSPVLVTSLEICSLVFQFSNTAGSQLVGASIFSDGAAATLITPGQGVLNFVDTMSYLIPDSREMMGYDIQDDGFHLRLDRELPSLLIREAPDALTSFLSKNGVRAEDVSYFLFHPGGKKILDFFEDKLNLMPDQYRWAREVLRDYGNMSSATIHFVIEKFLKDTELKAGELVVVMGIGPGLTLEFILLNAK